MSEEEAEKFQGELETLLRAHGVYLASTTDQTISINKLRTDHQGPVVRLWREADGFHMECETMIWNVRQPDMPSQGPGSMAPDTPW